MMSERPERRFAVPECEAAEEEVEPAAEETDPPAVTVFLRAVDETVARTLTPQAVDARFSRLKRAIAARASWHDEDLDHLAAELARYGHQVVRSWVVIIDSGEDVGGAERVALSDRDADELADNIVAKAVAGFRDELARVDWWLHHEPAAMKNLFLLECMLQLPGAYRSWLFQTERLSWDRREQQATWSAGGADDQIDLLGQLHYCVRKERRRIAYLLQARHTELEVSEILDATVETFDFAVGESTARGVG